MTRILTRLFILLHIFASPIFLQAYPNEKWQDCEQITKIAIEKLVSSVDKNDFENLETMLSTIQSACGENEFTQRMRILRALIEKKTTGAIIADYLSKNYQEVLVMRWDYSVENEYQKIYQENKADFNYIPLNHPIDSLVKLKANALLTSTSYNLTEQEKQIALLFSDHLDEFYKSYGSTAPAPTPVTVQVPAPETALEEPIEYSEDYKYRAGVLVSAGVEFPITGTDPLFKSNATIGVMYASPLSSLMVYELGAKIRINSNDRSFDYLLNEVIEHVNSTVSFSLGGNLGVKVFDNDKFIIFPKAGIYYDITGTGLTEYGEGYYYDEYGFEQSSGSIRYNNVNTMRTTLGLSVMRHIDRKKYIGLEFAYHYIPYNWDKNLLTNIQPNYASGQVFLRF